MVFDKYAVPLLQTIIEIDPPKKKKSKGNAGHETLGDLLLFTKDSNTESEGILKRNLANNRTPGIHKSITS